MRHLCCSLLTLLVAVGPGWADPRQHPVDLTTLSIEELLDLEISAAAKHEQTLSEAPASVSVVTRADLDRWGCRTLGDVLQRVRGFYISDDRQYQYLGTRGFSLPADYNDRVLVLLDGQPLNDNILGAVGIGTDLGLVMEAVERIEVVRGPGSALYGANAMFAVVNVIPRRGSDLDGACVSGEAGADGHRRGTVVFGRGSGDLDVSVAARWGAVDGRDLYYKEYDDPTTDNGVARDLDWAKYWGVQASARRGGLSMSGMLSSWRKGIPTGSFGVLFGDPRTRALDANGRLEVRLDQEVRPGVVLQARLFGGRSTYEGVFPFAVGPLSTEFREQGRGDWWGLEGRVGWELGQRHRVTTGAEYRQQLTARYRSWFDRAEYITEQFTYHLVSGYLQEEYRLRRDLTAVVGLRRDEYSSAGSSTTPRAALIYHPRPSTTLKLLFGEAFRAPNFYEVRYAETGVSKANPGLAAETIQTLEWVSEQRLGSRLLSTISLYRYRMDDLIEQRTDPADGLLQFQNTGQAKARGLELGLDARLSPSVAADASFSWQRAVDASGARLSNSPSRVLKLGLSRLLGEWSTISTDWRYETGRLTVHRDSLGQRQATDGYLLGDLHLVFRGPWGTGIRPGGRGARLAVSATLTNLLDTSYGTPGGVEHRQAVIAQDGRRWRLEAQYAF